MNRCTEGESSDFSSCVDHGILQADLAGAMPRKLMVKINLGALLLELSNAESDIEKSAAMLEECAKISTEALQLQAIHNIPLHSSRASGRFT
jgi:hypothetical protein